jgi:transcriptional regulator with XRE-family HTH domain
MNIEAEPPIKHEEIRSMVKPGILKPGMPFAEAPIAVFLTRAIDALQGTKSQREIAQEIGYEKPNMISMFKRGEAKVPLEKIPQLARAINVDPAHLLRMALQQYNPEFYKVIGLILDNKDIVTENEVAVIKEIRKLTGERDIHLTGDIKKRLKEAFKGFK